VRGHLLVVAGVCAALWMALTPAQAQVTKENVEGILNFHRLETTVACSGAVKPEALPNIKKMGFVSVINLREPTEPGANIVEEGEAAKAAGLKYYSIPFNANSPDAAAADSFSMPSPCKVRSRPSSIARAAGAQPRCGSSSVLPWITGTSTALRRKPLT